MSTPRKSAAPVETVALEGHADPTPETATPVETSPTFDIPKATSGRPATVNPYAERVAAMGQRSEKAFLIKCTEEQSVKVIKQLRAAGKALGVTVRTNFGTAHGGDAANCGVLYWTVPAIARPRKSAATVETASTE